MNTNTECKKDKGEKNKKSSTKQAAYKTHSNASLCEMQRITDASALPKKKKKYTLCATQSERGSIHIHQKPKRP